MTDNNTEVTSEPEVSERKLAIYPRDAVWVYFDNGTLVIEQDSYAERCLNVVRLEDAESAEALAEQLMKCAKNWEY